jgi:hypothetical protein
VETLVELIEFRELAKPSHKIHINRRVDKKETKDPKEDTTFHIV